MNVDKALDLKDSNVNKLITTNQSRTGAKKIKKPLEVQAIYVKYPDGSTLKVSLS